jgi:hypothetical protein
MTEKIYKYVPHHQSAAYEAAGWVFESYLGYPHAAYSSLYRWPEEGEPVMPEVAEITVDEPKVEE